MHGTLQHLFWPCFGKFELLFMVLQMYIKLCSIDCMISAIYFCHSWCWTCDFFQDWFNTPLLSTSTKICKKAYSAFSHGMMHVIHAMFQKHYECSIGLIWSAGTRIVFCLEPWGHLWRKFFRKIFFKCQKNIELFLSCIICKVSQ
jgi:hypothetical protein